jgi:hypothetical protein
MSDVTSDGLFAWAEFFVKIHCTHSNELILEYEQKNYLDFLEPQLARIQK